MKNIIFFLLLPVFASAQTVHVEKDRIIYKGMVKVGNLSSEELFARAKQAILNNVSGTMKEISVDKNEKSAVTAKGTIKLASPYYLKRTLEYTIWLQPGKGGYQYLIDSVYLKQVEQGEKTIKMPSGEILKGMESSGLVATTTEKLLNEIDMVFQKLIALIEKDMKKSSR